MNNIKKASSFSHIHRGYIGLYKYLYDLGVPTDVQIIAKSKPYTF